MNIWQLVWLLWTDDEPPYKFHQNFYISVNTRDGTASNKFVLTGCLSKSTIPQRLAVYQSRSALGPSVPVEGFPVLSVSREFRFPETMAVNESMAESMSET
jgi:hypothetical protein